MKFFPFLLLLFLLIGCKPDAPKEGSTSPDKEKETLEENIQLTVNIDELRLRDQAGIESKEIARLAKGSIVTDAGEVSDFSTRIKLRGVQFDEPWLKVRTAAGQEGWVYGGGLNFELGKGGELAELLIKKRLQTLYGKEIAKKIYAYRAGFQAIKTDKELHDIYRQGIEIRDTLNYLMESRIAVENYDRLPDLFWLEQAIPAYVPQLVAEGTAYYLFNDYKEWIRKAHASQGTADDDFFELCLEVHSVDSIEYFFPSWFLQTWDYGGHSLLGQGIHQKVMREIDRLYKNQSPFVDELRQLKQTWLRDIYGEGISYWEDQPAVVKELTNIIKDDYSILTLDDRIALKMRLKMLENPAANGLEVNHRAGKG